MSARTEGAAGTLDEKSNDSEPRVVVLQDFRGEGCKRHLKLKESKMSMSY